MRKINIDPKKPDPRSIKDKKNFNEILSQFNEIQAKGNTNGSKFDKGWSLNSIFVFAGIIIISAAIYLWPDTQTKPTNEQAIISENIIAQEEDTTSFTYKPKENAASDKLLLDEEPFVNPPLPSIDIPYKSYTINGKKGGTIKYGNSTIRIPKKAFVDKNRNTIEEDVTIKYREFHDVVDCFVSGIPMEYDSAGYTYTFESAGMIDIKGFRNNKEIFIAPDKSLKIEMESKTADTKYNLYYLDVANKNWDYKGKDSILNINQPSAIQAIEWDFGVVDQSKPYYEEINKLTNDVSEAQVKYTQQKKDNITFENNQKPAEPKKYDDDKYTFNIDVDSKEFPELAVFDNLKFEVSESNKNFSSDFYAVKWDDAKIEEHKQGISYKLKLIKGERVENLIVYPVFEGKSFEQAKELFDQQLASYNQKLKERKEEEERLKQDLIAKQKELEAKRLMQVEEIEKQRKEAYARASKAAKTTDAITRAFNVNKFGTWNCDSPVKPPRGKSIDVTFVDANNKSLNLVAVRLVEDKRNASFNYFSNMFDNFKFNPDEQNYLFGFTPEMKLAYAKPDDFAKIDKQKNYNFELHILEETITSAIQLKNILNIN